jgi:nicotinate-nucleotide--dimethylbenzimidazole phosphoribosyltransferase
MPPLLAAARAAVDGKAKPPGSLGLLEEWGIQLCELQGTLTPHVTSMCLLLFAADHGITRDAPAVSAYPRQVGWPINPVRQLRHALACFWAAVAAASQRA